MKLSKSIIKKYGISKKAWAVQRGQKTHSRGGSMAKKRHSRGRGGGLGGGLMRAPLRTSGIIQGVLLGVAGAVILNTVAPGINIPYKNAIAGYIVGGLPGAAAAYLVGNMGVGSTGTAATTGQTYY